MANSKQRYCSILGLYVSRSISHVYILGWNDWTLWSNCDVTCGVGQETRSRTPIGERRCEGDSSESRYCTVAACPCKSIITFKAINCCRVENVT